MKYLAIILCSLVALACGPKGYGTLCRWDASMCGPRTWREENAKAEAAPVNGVQVFKISYISRIVPDMYEGLWVYESPWHQKVTFFTSQCTQDNLVVNAIFTYVPNRTPPNMLIFDNGVTCTVVTTKWGPRS
jgi:hypothetical protein